MELINKALAFLQSGMVQAILLFLLLAVEFWLGRTDVVKPGSTLEAIFRGIKKFLELIKVKKPS